MNLVTIMGVIAAFTLLIPALIILFCRLTANKSLLTLFFYFTFSAVYNLMSEGVFRVSDEVLDVTATINNYLEVPLMCACMLFFCTTPRHEKLIRSIFFGFVFYEVALTVVFGFNMDSAIYILGPGIAILFIVSIYFFVRYARISIEKNKQTGKTLMITALLFAYGCYAMVYSFLYLQKTSAVADVFLIYYIASILTSLLMSIGLVWIIRRSRKIREVQLTRKELAMFFNR